MIPFNCPHCTHHMELPDEFAGQRATCTRCGIPFATPELPGGQGNAEIWAEVYGERTNDPYGQRSQNAYGPRTAEDPEEASPEAVPQREIPDWVDERHRKSHDRLSPAFWGMAYFIPPAALLWAIALPKAHPQKKVALAMPIVWMLIIGGIGATGNYVLSGNLIGTQQTSVEAANTSASDPALQNTPAAPAATWPPQGWLDVTNLQPREMYRVTKRAVPISGSPSGRNGMFGGLYLYEIPIGGIFEIVESTLIDGDRWYHVYVTDGVKFHQVWIVFSNLRRAGLELVPPPTFGDATLPYSVPIRRLY